MTAMNNKTDAIFVTEDHSPFFDDPYPCKFPDQEVRRLTSGKHCSPGGEGVRALVAVLLLLLFLAVLFHWQYLKYSTMTENRGAYYLYTHYSVPSPFTSSLPSFLGPVFTYLIFNPTLPFPYECPNSHNVVASCSQANDMPAQKTQRRRVRSALLMGWA